MPTMHPFDDAGSFLSATSTEGSFEPRQQQQQELGGAASSSPSRGTRGGGENAGITCQDCRHRRGKAHCARCCSSRGFVCPGHVTSSQQCSKHQQQTPAAVNDVEPIPSKRPRRTALPSAAAAAPTTTSSVDQPMLIATTTTTVLEGFAREVSMDAVFRRVLLGGPEPEVAYYTTITIAGHVFRGVLYDADPGPHSGSTAASDTDGSGGEGSSLSSAGDSCLDLALGL